MALDALFSWYIEKRIARITKFTNEAESCQANVLHDLIAKAQNTSFGITYHFSEIKDYSSFKSKVPLGDYNSLKKYIELAKDGTSDVLWPGKSIWFAKSSGTTGERMKVLPVTKDALHNNHHADGASPKFKHRWFEIDIGWTYIQILQFLRLAKLRT